MHDRYISSLLSSIETRIRRLEWLEAGPSQYDQDHLERRIVRLITEKIMPTIDETLAKVTESGDRLDSLLIYVGDLKKNLEEALAGQITPDMQAKIDAIFAEAEENRGKIDKALNTNVPPPEPAPV
jgi:hypothetical protein